MNYMAIRRMSAIGATTTIELVITTRNLTIIDKSEFDEEIRSMPIVLYATQQPMKNCKL